MKKIVFMLSMFCFTASMFALNIYSTPSKKKKNPYRSAETEVTKEEALKYEIPRPDKTVCPVTGVPIEVDEKTPMVDYQGKKYYFLNEEMKAQFDKDPFGFAKNIETCDICGRQEKKLRGNSSFITLIHNGITYHFDSVMHKEEFSANPAKYAIGKKSYNTKPLPKKKAKAKPWVEQPIAAVTPEAAVAVSDLKIKAPEITGENKVTETKTVLDAAKTAVSEIKTGAVVKPSAVVVTEEYEIIEEVVVTPEKK